MIRSERLPLEKRDQAVAEMERLAESGDMNAQYLMGKLLRDGPLLIPDIKARRWLEWAVAQGHTAAQYALGKLLISGTLGHYSTEFTLDVYTNVTKEMQKDAAKKIGGFWKPRTIWISSIGDSFSVSIDEEQLSRLFDRFYRADPSRSSETGGHGIGLSIAKAVVLAYSDEICTIS